MAARALAAENLYSLERHVVCLFGRCVGQDNIDALKVTVKDGEEEFTVGDTVIDASVKAQLQAMANQFRICTPAAAMRLCAASRFTALKVPEASTATKTSKPSLIADNAGKATQTSVTMPAKISCFLPVAFTAATNSSLSQALI